MACLNRVGGCQAFGVQGLFVEDRIHVAAIDDTEQAGIFKLCDHNGRQSAADIPAAIGLSEAAICIKLGHGNGLFRTLIGAVAATMGLGARTGVVGQSGRRYEQARSNNAIKDCL